MIKKFNLFESNIIKHEIVLDELIDYAKNDAHIIIHNFIEDIYLNKNIIEFDCHRCYIKNYTKNVHQKHKGVITGIEYNFDDDIKEIYFSAYLNNIDYSHKVNTKKPLIIYGQIPDNTQRILNELEIFKKDLELFNDIKNYNL